MALGRVREQRTFRLLRTAGTRGRSGPVTVIALLDHAAERPCAAFAVGRRVGPAVVRNRVRRRLRAIATELDLAPGAYLVAAGPDCVGLPYDQLRRHVTAAITSATGSADTDGVR